jgi:hypothetical protein
MSSRYVAGLSHGHLNTTDCELTRGQHAPRGTAHAVG